MGFREFCPLTSGRKQPRRPQWEPPAPEDRPGPEYSELPEGAYGCPAGIPDDTPGVIPDDMPGAAPDVMLDDTPDDVAGMPA